MNTEKPINRSADVSLDIVSTEILSGASSDAESSSLETPPEETEISALDVSYPILDVILRDKNQVILGGPGSGKSTLFHYAILALCNSRISDLNPTISLKRTPIPFLVELRQYVLSGSPGFIEYIVSNTAKRYGVSISAESLEALLREDGGALIVFDGLDEIFESSARADALDAFDTFARKYSTTYLAVTSRIVGYDANELGIAGFTHYTLLDFTLPQIRLFVPKGFAWN